MSEVRRISGQLKRAFQGEAWHGPSLKELLAGVTAEQAARHPIADAHSIWELVLHITAWEGAALQRVTGEYVQAPDEGAWPAVDDQSETAWQNTLARVERRHQELRSALFDLGDEQLNSPLAEGKESAYFLLHGVVQHMLYHAGQIALLKKN